MQYTVKDVKFYCGPVVRLRFYTRKSRNYTYILSVNLRSMYSTILTSLTFSRLIFISHVQNETRNKTVPRIAKTPKHACRHRINPREKKTNKRRVF